MQSSRLPKYEKSRDAGALRQGEILSKVLQVNLLPESIDTLSPTVKRVSHDYAIVVTPECDLDWDFKAQQGNESQGKLISNILLCTVIFASDLARRINNDRPLSKRFETRTPWERTRQNKEERYHFLEEIDPNLDLQGQGTRSLGIDFKEFFTLPTDFLYSSIAAGLTQRRSVLLQPYNDHLNSRFAHFQSRIGLPEDHQYTRGEIFLGGESSQAFLE